MAARTSRMKIGTGAIILPWWPNPTRVAEKVAMLDILLGGRFMLGFGRGLARKEYEAFGIDMNESRERFDEAAEIILDILETGIAEYDTEFFKQDASRSTRAPETNFREVGFQSVAMTPDSGVAAANLGATMMSFVQLPWEQHHARSRRGGRASATSIPTRSPAPRCSRTSRSATRTPRSRSTLPAST